MPPVERDTRGSLLTARVDTLYAEPDDWSGEQSDRRTSEFSLSILIPVFNERASLEKLLDRIVERGAPELARQIVVVDDGSTDGSWEILQDWRQRHPEVNLDICRHETNSGKGAAIRTALAHARGEATIVQDADLEYDPADYEQVVMPILNGEAEAVYGSRYLSGTNDLRWTPNRVCVHLLNGMVRILYAQKITDEATCYKAFRTELLKSLDLQCRRFEFCPEVTAKVCRLRIPIKEVPIAYSPRTKREGKKIGWKDGAAAIWELVKWRVRRPGQAQKPILLHSSKILTLILLSMLLCSAGCGVKTASSGSPEEASVFGDEDHRMYDFGVVLGGNTRSHTFHLKNLTGHMIAFERFRATCSCTGITIDKKTIAPGDSFEVSTVFHAANKNYDTAPGIVVEFNDEVDNPWQLQLGLRAKVRLPLAISTSSLKWSSIGDQELPPTEFLIWNYDSKPWEDVSISCREEWLEFQTEPIDAELESTQTWRCTVRPKNGQLEFGSHSAFIRVRADSLDREIILPAKVDVTKPVVLVPDRVFHIRTAGGSSQNVDLSIISRIPTAFHSSEDFEVISALGEAVKPEVIQDGSGRWILQCHISPRGDVIRDEIQVRIPALDTTVNVPVFVSASADMEGK